MYRYTYMYIYINIYIDSTEKEITGCGSVFSIYSRRYLHTYIYIHIYVCIYKCVYIIHIYMYIYVCILYIYIYIGNEERRNHFERNGAAVIIGRAFRLYRLRSNLSMRIFWKRKYLKMRFETIALGFISRYLYI
jgi:hypothetical protein